MPNKYYKFRSSIVFIGLQTVVTYTPVPNIMQRPLIDKGDIFTVFAIK